MRKRLVLAAALAAVFCGACLPCAAADIYVDAVNGNDAFGGTSWAAAKQSFVAAYSAAANGDTLHFAKGVYASPGAIAKSYLTLLGGYPAGGGVRNPAVNETQFPGGLVLAASWVTVDGFSLGGNIASTGLAVQASAWWAEILNCRFVMTRAGNLTGVDMQPGLQYAAVRGCYFDLRPQTGNLSGPCAVPLPPPMGGAGWSATGVLVNGASNVVVENCSFKDFQADRGVSFVFNCECGDCQAPGGAGGSVRGIHALNSCGLQIYGNAFENLRAGNGGDVYANDDCPGFCAGAGGAGGSAYAIHLHHSGGMLSGNYVEGLAAGKGGALQSPGPPGLAQPVYESDPDQACPLEGTIPPDSALVPAGTPNIYNWYHDDYYGEPGAWEIYWSKSAVCRADDYVVYAGNLSDFAAGTLSPWVEQCSTGGYGWAFMPGGGSSQSLYFLIVPKNAATGKEGCAGLNSNGQPRQLMGPSCNPRIVTSCGPQP